MDIKTRLKIISKERRVLSAIQKIMELESTKHAINLMYIEFWSKMSSFPEEDVIESYMGIDDIHVTRKEVILKHHYTPNTDYEKIADKATGFGYGNTIRYGVCIERVISGFTFRITDFIDATIPEEEMKLLTILGKTKTEVTQPIVHTNVFCEF